MIGLDKTPCPGGQRVEGLAPDYFFGSLLVTPCR